MSVEDMEPEFDNTQEHLRDLRMRHLRDQGHISEDFFKAYLIEAGKANNLLLKRYSVAAEQTPQPKRLKASPCTPEHGMMQGRIKAGLSACIRHPNGDCHKLPNEINKDWEPKVRHPGFLEKPENERERLERHEMGIAESQAFRARKFARSSLAFGTGRNVP